MTQSDLIAAAIADAGGTAAVKDAVGLGSTESVRVWIERGVPAKYVIPLCELGGWKHRPHDIDSTLYPNPSDGLPRQRAA
jgi:hypothetical protein